MASGVRLCRDGRGAFWGREVCWALASAGQARPGAGPEPDGGGPGRRIRRRRKEEEAKEEEEENMMKRRRREEEEEEEKKQKKKQMDRCSEKGDTSEREKAKR